MCDIYGGPSYRCAGSFLEAKLLHVKLLYILLDDSYRTAVTYIIIDTLRKQYDLMPVLAFNVAHKSTLFLCIYQ
jgi:hypothetical protein